MGLCSPKQPFMLARIADARFASFVNLCRVGNLVYGVGTSSNSLNIIDVTVPSVPVVLATLKDNVALSGAEGVRVFGSYAFVACQAGARLTVIDISNPYAPAVAASLQDATRFSGGTNLRLGADGQTAYFTTLTRASLATVDLSNPLAPAFLAEQRGPTPGSSMNGARDVILSRDGRYAFVTCDTANCVAVIDVSDRTAINWVTSITHAAMGSARGIALSADGNTLYVLAGGSAAQGFNGALLLIDVSNPTSPAIISVFAGYGGFGAVTYFAGGRGIVLYQNLAFITSETGAGLIVLDVSNPQQIRFLGGTKGPVPGTSLNGAMGIDITNGIASIACFTGAFVTAKAVWPSP